MIRIRSSTASQVLAINGTATAPAVASSANPKTGFFWVTANELNLSLNGVNKVSWSGINNQYLLGSTFPFGWSSQANPQNAGLDVGFVRSAAGIVEVNNGTAGNYRDMLVRDIRSNASQITAGSGTGVTVNDGGSIKRSIYKVTVDYTALAAAALTADKTIATLPAKTKLVGIIADTTIKYIGGAVSAATLIVGKTVGGNQYIVSHDVFTAAVTKGLADADLGTSINRANAIQAGDLPSFTATTDISVRLTTVTANTNALTQGSTTYYLITEAMP